MSSDIKLHAPIDISSDDVERALFEQAKDEPAVSRAYDHLRGSTAKLAADELNHVLNVDAFDVFARGWAKVPRVHSAVQRSVLAPGPPTIIRLDQHTITSTSYPVLNITLAQSALPELRLALELIADVQDATLAVRDGRIEVVALGKASVVARLKYKSALLKEHTTGVEGALRDPFKHQRATPDAVASVDIYI